MIAGCGEHQEAVISLRHRAKCSTFSASRAAKRAKTKLLQESACDSIIRNQEMPSRRVEHPAERLARSKCASKGMLWHCLQGLPKVWTPARWILRRASRRRTKDGFVAFFRCLSLRLSAGLIFFSFGPAQTRAKPKRKRVRRPQEFAVVRQKCAEQASAAARAHLPHKLQAVQETSQP